MSRLFRKVLVVLFVVLLFWAAALVIARRRTAPSAANSANSAGPVSPELVNQFTALEAKENELNRAVWAKEILGEECGRVFESLWDSLNAATNKFSVLKSFQLGELVPGLFGPPQKLAHGIELREPTGVGPPWSEPQWRQFLEHSQRAGWELAHIEFRHNRFDTDEAGKPQQSYFYFSARLTNVARAERAVLEGDLIVAWAPKQSDEEPAAIKRIDASHVTVRTRRGEPAFRQILAEQIAPPAKSYFIDPLILYDLDGDGLSEIILAAKNLVYHRRGEDRYEPQSLCKYPPGLIFTGVVADFDGDGVADFLCATFDGLVLFKGSSEGTFDEPGRPVWSVNPHLKYAQALTCGDIDGDGDLDVFIGQYKVPYTRGQMPTPYYDANDGNPAYLLLNDGHGNFTDATAAAGLEKKRWRRTYSASLVDLNDDGILDLLVVSDFAGVDLYRNDSRGHFTDVTREWVAEPHAFGMAHALADFNADGRLDILMIGMNSPVADRLEHLGLWRPGIPEDQTKRSRVTFGNRLCLARPAGGFEQTTLNDSIARSGWSWGCSAFDFDNDGFPDAYIANGHETKQSVRDYETEFWLHDAYVGSSKEDPVLAAYFSAKMSRTRGRGYSFGGYEKNRLYLNQQGASFLDVGHLMGVALEADSRGVVTDDLDGDGRIDLLVTTFEAWPEAKQTLQIFKNTLEDSGNWIGFRFREERNGVSPVGARVTVRYSGRTSVRQIVTGDSYRSQHANTVHFGLGKAERVDQVEIRWPDGRTLTLREAAVNRYHNIRGPVENVIQR
ncbi:MAG: hypothetical protein DME22_09545 [Verrucomicrobia bacterium]|nr:MAG: hypothetical protein DME22_09545 [Verrucomicrobiota bacterium]